MRIKKHMDIEVSISDILSKIVDENGSKWVVREIMDDAEICALSSIDDLIKTFGEEEILQLLSDSAIENEYLRRTPLGRALE